MWRSGADHTFEICRENLGLQKTAAVAVAILTTRVSELARYKLYLVGL
jgi:hypothetical protein